MFVKFVSDGSVEKGGFSATFMKEQNECELQDHGCEHICVNTLGGFLCSCYVGYELKSDKKSCESEYQQRNNILISVTQTSVFSPIQSAAVV